MQKYGMLSIIVGGLVGVGIIVTVVLNHVQPAQPTPTKDDQLSSQTPKTAQSSDTPEDLTFTGAVSGHMTNGRTGDTYTCEPTTTGPIVGNVGGSDYAFSYRAETAKGAGSYRAYAQISPVGDKSVVYASDNIFITINPDRRSGVVEGQLHNLKDVLQTVTVSGTWNCPPDF